MSSAISETETFDATVTGPDAGDPRTAASVRLPSQGVANRTKYLKARWDMLTGVKHVASAVVGAPTTIGAIGGELTYTTSARVNSVNIRLTLLNLLEDDIVIFGGQVQARVAASGDIGWLGLGDTTDAFEVPGFLARVVAVNAEFETVPITGIWTVPADTPSRLVCLQGYVTGSDTMTLSLPYNLHALVLRA